MARIKRKLSTDYFFEALFKKVKHYLMSNDILFRKVVLRVVLLVSWLKDVN